MTMSLRRRILTCVALLAATTAVSAGENDRHPGAVQQSVGAPIAQNPKPPVLDLSDAQRAKIREAVANQHSDVSFSTAAGKKVESFQPAIGEKIPASIKGRTLPSPVIAEMPKLKQYTYVKFKDQILIVNPMSRSITEIIPLT